MSNPEANEDLLPSEDGSCHCGATMMNTGPGPCWFCGGYTAEQLALAALDRAQRDTRHVAERERAGERIEPGLMDFRVKGTNEG